MSGAKAMGRAARNALGIAAASWISVAGASANDGFGGSFDSGGTVSPAPTQPVSGGGGDGFGGSFDTGGLTNPQPTPTPTPSPQPDVPVIGGDDFDPNGFDNNNTAPIVNVDPTPQPQPQPTPTPQPTPQPQPPVVQIDPQILAFESRDFGVPPTNQLRAGQLHAPTPTSLPGATTVNTAALAGAIGAGQQLILIDVLGANYSLPRAVVAPALASPGHFQDRTQQQAVQWLAQITGNRRDLPIVIFCSDPQCWLSYNAALRTVAAGFTNVYWYRGGLQAWQMAGLQVMPAQF